MTRKLITLTSWIAANPLKIRLIIFTILLVLAMAAVLLPGVTAMAEWAPGGGG
jgi:hypothetical protein